MSLRSLRKQLARLKRGGPGKAGAAGGTRWTRGIAGRFVPLLGVCVQGIVGLYVVYLVAVNGAMASGLAERAANQNPDKFLFQFSSAYSLWPGSVHAKHFLFRGQDSVVQWRIELDDATAHFELRELFAKRVHMTTGQADGASVRIRTKIDVKNAGSARAKMLPPISGFSDPPILGPSVPDPPDDAYPYFTFDIENGAGEHVREVWFDTFHLTDATLDVKGGFYLKPNRRVVVMPGTLHLKDATLQEGETVVAQHVHGTIDIHVEPFDPRKPTGREILAYVDAKAYVGGTLDSLRFLNLHLIGEPIGFAGGGGPFLLAVDVLHGTFQPDSRVKARFENWQVFSAPHRVSGTTTADASVGPAREAVGSFESYDVSLHRGLLEVVHIPVLGVLARTKSVDVSQPIADWALSVEAPSGKVPDVAVVNMYANKPLFVGGTAAFSIHLDATDRQARARGRATFDQTTLVLADRQFLAAGSLAFMMTKLDLHTGHGDLTGTGIEVHDLVYGKGKGEATWWAQATVGPGDFSLKLGTVNLTLSGKARDAKPVWSLLKVPGWIADLLGGNALTLAGNVRVGPGLFEIPHVRSVGEDFDVQARYRARGPSKKGTAFLRRGPITAGVEIDGDNVSVRPLASEAWFRGADAKL